MKLVSYCVHIVSIILCTCNSVCSFVYICYQYCFEMNNTEPKISHHLQVLWVSHFKCYMSLHHTELTVKLPTEMGNIN